eukprot:6954643-Alexandrium_andersonii.AAC.1
MCLRARAIKRDCAFGASSYTYRAAMFLLSATPCAALRAMLVDSPAEPTLGASPSLKRWPGWSESCAQ